MWFYLVPECAHSRIYSCWWDGKYIPQSKTCTLITGKFYWWQREKAFHLSWTFPALPAVVVFSTTDLWCSTDFAKFSVMNLLYFHYSFTFTFSFPFNLGTYSTSCSNGTLNPAYSPSWHTLWWFSHPFWFYSALLHSESFAIGWLSI